jgi:glycosyltransferase involved in cell wall biosynthesis/2-polyprenyl-3-methyl-5-hydroxy-6-metoxy-1,4-benzoquinol methylase
VNVLLALYQNFESNSANHVDGIARVLCALGCDCIVAVPAAPKKVELMGDVPYKTGTFWEILEEKVGFDNGRDLDVAHFWTPREVSRLFWERLRANRRFATVIHMEDNEEMISRSQLRADFEEFAHGRKRERFPAHLSHPKYWKGFLTDADALTIIVDSLRDIVPADKPIELIWPSTDAHSFYPRKHDPALRAELGIPPNHAVLAYHGNVHHANFREVRSLYLAVALLNREGVPATLLRMGRDHVEGDHDYRDWAAAHSKNVGFVASRDKLAAILSLADVFVQPGLCDAFNEYRFPSKVPDFLALGKPLILPRINIGLAMRHGIDAYVLEEADGTSIADAVKLILKDADLHQRLSAGSRQFFEENLGWPTTAAKLLGLYRLVAREKTDAVVPNIKQGETMNINKRYAKTKFPPLSYATVRDYCDSSDNLKFLCTMNDLKDVQRPWSAKALIGELAPGGSILEIGAGEPLVASFMSSLGWKVSVCDPYDGSGHGPTEYNQYRKAYPKVDIMRSVFNESVAEPMRGSLDAVYSISVLEHVPPAELEKLFAGIEIALKPGGVSLHCADAVVQGSAADYHLEQMARILQFQNRLAGQQTSWDDCMGQISSLITTAMQDLETFFLGPQGHNLWRGGTDYEKFPFRKCISVQFVMRKKR